MSEGEILPDTRSEAAPTASVAQEPAPPWEQRILQLEGKRYSLRLEHEFWSALEAIAARRKLRLNRLVADVAARRPADANLSSVLRVFCLGEKERAAGSRSMSADGANIAALVEGAPAAGLVLDHEAIVLAANDAFLRWSGLQRAQLLGHRLGDRFTLQGASGFDSLWRVPAREKKARIVGVMPGRVVAAEASFVPLPAARGRRLCVVWVMGS